jgi:hypothetical protein
MMPGCSLSSQVSMFLKNKLPHFFTLNMEAAYSFETHMLS